MNALINTEKLINLKFWLEFIIRNKSFGFSATVNVCTVVTKICMEDIYSEYSH